MNYDITIMKKVLFSLITCIFILSCGPSQPEPDSPPNILFIEVDDLTAKYLGIHGAKIARTPNIDSLAQSGVIFKNAMAQGVMCTPSRNSLITGKYPHELGLYENLDLKSLPKDIWAFPMTLQQHGYTNFWVGKNHLIPYRGGLQPENVIDLKNKAIQCNMGFDSVYQSYGRSMVIDMAKQQFKTMGCWEEGIDSYGDFLFKNGLLEKFMEEGGGKPTTLDPDTESMDGHFTTYAMNKLSEYTEEGPFFMWLNYSGPHGPFNVQEEYGRGLYNNQMPPIIDPAEANYELPEGLRMYPNNIYNDYTTLGYRRKYVAAISYVDSQIGRLLDFIENSRYKDNTVIVFFSDHGIMTGDHGLLGKNTLFKEVLDAALIISYPKKFKPKFDYTPVELIDLVKTTLDIAQVEDSTIRSIKNGHSLLPLLDCKGKFEGDRLAFSEMRDFKAVFDGVYKYIHHEETPLLFNLEKNPNETENWLERNPEKAAELKKEIEDWLSR